MQKHIYLKLLSCLISGAVLPLGFSPYNYPLITILSLACLFYVVLNSSARDASLSAYAYGFGMFGLGVNWLHISINLFGGVNLIGAYVITYMLVAFLSLYPALLAYLYHRFFGNKNLLTFVVVMPVLWMLAEWFRAWIFTGFPWLNIGYSQIDTPIASLAPVLGVYGVSWFTALISSVLVALIFASNRLRLILIGLISIGCFALVSLGSVHWTTDKNKMVSVALIQGAIPQEIKWNPEQRQATLDLYMALSNQYNDSQLIIWPETAIPVLYHQAQEFFEDMTNIARTQNQDFLTGIPFKDLETNKFYNGISVIGSSKDIYYKQHLVPFGEFLPFDKWLRPILNYLKIPMSDFSSGPQRQPIVTAAGEKIGVSICYEDVFGEEVIAALPEATLLVNISNDAWFGDSIAPHQHLQMARMRALETGRYMLRATNTGVSAIIDERGEIIARSPQFVPHVTSAKVKTYEGLTPYARYGNWPVISSAFLLLLITFIAIRKQHKPDV